MPATQQRRCCNGPGAACERLSFDAALIRSHCPAAAISRDEVHVGAGLETRVVPNWPPTRLYVHGVNVVAKNHNVWDPNESEPHSGFAALQLKRKIDNDILSRLDVDLRAVLGKSSMREPSPGTEREVLAFLDDPQLGGQAHAAQRRVPA